MNKPRLPSYCEYFEAEIEGRRCWVQKGDVAIMSGLAGHVTATAPKLFRDLPEDAFIVKLIWSRKVDRHKQLGAGV